MNAVYIDVCLQSIIMYNVYAEEFIKPSRTLMAILLGIFDFTTHLLRIEIEIYYRSFHLA